MEQKAKQLHQSLSMYHIDNGHYPLGQLLTDEAWALENLEGINSSLFQRQGGGSGPGIVNRDPVPGDLNRTNDYFESGIINYRGSDGYVLFEDGSFDDNTRQCEIHSYPTGCNTYVVVYRESGSDELIHSYGEMLNM